MVRWLKRLGRSLPDFMHIVAGFQEKSIGFVSITKKTVVNSARGKLIFHILAALAEFYRNLILERTRAGLVTARYHGCVRGRKPKLVNDRLERSSV